MASIKYILTFFSFHLQLFHAILGYNDAATSGKVDEV